MSLPYVVDGETELNSELFNPWVDHMNGLQTGALPIALAGIEGALGEYGPLGSVVSLRQRIYNAYDYGARADNGATDNYSALQSAINECSSDGGGIVDLPQLGNYVYHTRPSLKSGVTLRGRGRGTVLYPAYESLTTGLWYDQVNGMEDVGLFDLALSREGAFVHHGIQISRCAGLRMDNVSVLGSRAYVDGSGAQQGGAIILGGFTDPGPSDLVSDVQIGRLYFWQADNYGLQLGYVRGVTVESILAELCYREVLGIEPGVGATAEDIAIGTVMIRQGGARSGTSSSTGAVIVTQSSGGVVDGVSIGTVNVSGDEVIASDITPGVTVLGGTSVSFGSINVRKMNGSGVRVGNIANQTNRVQLGSVSIAECNQGENEGHEGAAVSLRNATQIMVLGAQISGGKHTNAVLETEGADYNRVVYSYIDGSTLGSPAANSAYAENVVS